MTLQIMQAFQGSPHFELRRELGSGGFGVVFEAFDRTRQIPVALKTLHRMDPNALYAFKQEFRSLADVSHRNLVTLYELLSENGQWFFTMEVLQGQTFRDYVARREEPPVVGLVPGAATIELTDQLSLTEEVASLAGLSVSGGAVRAGGPVAGEGGEADAGAPVSRRAAADLERLRSALRQLVEGVSSLHSAGKLHRDLKPSNVLVTGEGRVVLLDFGLVRDLRQPLLQLEPEPRVKTRSDRKRSISSLDEESDEGLAGTPGYMAPEAATGSPTSEASDWYSVGVMLYEALTGSTPFRGSMLEVLQAKISRDPIPPSELVAGVPADLEALCMALLSRDPALRPGSGEILQRLARGGDAGVKSGRAAPPPLLPLTGRQAQLEALHDALEATRSGHAVLVRIEGRSGMGKSALVQGFLSQVEAEGDALILTGRCYERESLPYKALDSVVDALSRALRRMSEKEVEALLPPDILALARQFPVLERVPSLAIADRRVLSISNPIELRRHGFGALRTLLAGLASRFTTVIAIDDLQWGDADSAAILSELLRPPHAPPVLVLGSHRSDEAATSPFLKAFTEQLGLDDRAVDVRTVRVEELEPGAALELVAAQLRRLGLADRVDADRIVREAGGSPLFIDALINQRVAALEQGDTTDAGTSSLEQVLLGFVSSLPPSARRLLQVVSVAGEPISQTVVRDAAAIKDLEADGMALLRARRLVRTRTGEGGDEVETYHDRIRETVVRHLEPDVLRSWHLNLGEVLERGGKAMPETLALHFQRGGAPARAFGYTLTAAERAVVALAFDRAAELYRTALELRELSPEARRPLLVKLGDALRNANRGREAADVYLEASRTAGAEALALQRLAAEQLLYSGHLEEGRALLQPLSQKLGQRFAKSRNWALVAFLLRRAWFRLRGLEPNPTPSRPDSALLAQIDICRAVSLGLAFVDVMHGADFQSRQLALALKAGEPGRLARALMGELNFVALGGSRATVRVEALRQRVLSLAAQLGDPALSASTGISLAGSYWLEGRWAEALDQLSSAEEGLRRSPAGYGWELSTAVVIAVSCLYLAGRWNALAARLPGDVLDARTRRDAHLESHLRLFFLPTAYLIEGQLEEARQEVERAIALWGDPGSVSLYMLGVYARMNVALYQGQGRKAWADMEGALAVARKGMAMHPQFSRVNVWVYRGRAALGAAAEIAHDGGSRREIEGFLRETRRCVRQLRKEDVPWCDALRLLLEAGVESVRSRREVAIERLEAAEAAATRASMPHVAAFALLRRGALQGAGGEAVRAAGEEALRAEGARDPARVADMWAPGVW